MDETGRFQGNGLLQKRKMATVTGKGGNEGIAGAFWRTSRRMYDGFSAITLIIFRMKCKTLRYSVRHIYVLVKRYHMVLCIVPCRTENLQNNEKLFQND